MPLSRDQKIIVTSADGSKRRRLPAFQITKASARVERYGGYGQFSVDTAIPFSGDALSTILKGDRVEMYYGGVLRYRGWIEERMRVEGEPDTLGFVGYGLSFLLGQQLCYGRYAYAGNGADLATVFAEVVRDATQSRNQTLPPAMGRQGLPLYDALQVLQVGALTTFVDAYHKLLGDVANDLVQQSGNLCIWGGDVDAFGQNRAHFRPLAAITGTPMHVIPVPARRTQTAQAEDQAGDVKNRTLMTGGPPRFPQMLHNGGFDLPAAFQTGDSGLITDGDFEQQSWALSNGAAYKDAGHQEGQPFSGNWMVELDHVGEACDKNGAFATTPVAGHSYVFSVRAKKEVGLQTADGSGWLHLNDASNNLLLSVPLMVAPTGTAWDYFSATFPMPAGAVHWLAHFQCDHVASYNGDSGGLLIDAVSLEDGSVVYQDGWQVEAFGSAAFAAVNWAYKDVAFDGLYCVYLSPRCADANGQDGWLVPLGRARISVLFKQTLRLSFRYRSPLSPALGLPKMQLQLDWFRSDGSDIRTDTLVINAAAANSTWQYAELAASAPSDAASVLPRINPRSNGDILVDCFSLQDAEAVAAGDVPLMPDGHPGFLPEGDLSTFLTASASGLGGDYASSEFAYGSRVDITSQGAVNTLPGLTTVAKARLGVKALALIRPGIARMEDATVYWPGDSVGLQGKHGGLLNQGQLLTIAAVDLTFGDLFVVNLEIGKEAPDETLAVKSLIQEQLQKNGPGGAAGAGGTGGGYSNSTNFGGAGGGGATTPVTLQTITESATDSTTHEQVRTGPHVSDQEHTDLAATKAEVVAARTRTVKGISYTTTEGRLDAMEIDIAHGSLPGGTADGQTLRWNQATSAYVVDPFAVNNGTGTLTLTALGGSNTGLTLTNQGAGSSDLPAVLLNSHDAATTVFTTNHGHPLGCIAGFFTTATDGFVVLASDGSKVLFAGQNKRVGINTTSPRFDFEVNGNACVTGVSVFADVAATHVMYVGGGTGLLANAAAGDGYLRCDTGDVHLAAHYSGGSSDLQITATQIVGRKPFAGPHSAADGTAGVSGTSGGGDTLKNGLVVGLGNEATLRANAVAAEATARANGDVASAQKAANLSDLASATTARTNLGLGTAAVASLPAAGSNASSVQVVRGDDTRLGSTGAAARATATVTSMVLASHAIDNSHTLTLGKSGLVLQIATDVPAWVRMYDSQAAMTADAARPGPWAAGYAGPTAGMGVLLEVATTAAMLTIPFSPVAGYANLDAPGGVPNNTYFLAIGNASGTTQTITVTMIHLPIEN